MTEEQKEKRRRYYQENKEVFAAAAKKYRQTHRTQYNAYQRAYRQNNPLLVRQWKENAKMSAYYKKNAENGEGEIND